MTIEKLNEANQISLTIEELQKHLRYIEDREEAMRKRGGIHLQLTPYDYSSLHLKEEFLPIAAEKIIYLYKQEVKRRIKEQEHLFDNL